MTGIQLNGVTKRYGETEVITGLDLNIHEGEFLVFLGPSGCGKSTLIRCSGAGLRNCRAVSGSASRLAALSSRNPKHFCSTSRFRISMHRCEPVRGSSWRAFIAA